MPAPTSKTLTIARAQPGDADGIARLLRANGLPADDFLPHLEHFAVAHDSGQIAGVVGLEMHAPIGLLRSLVVEASCRKSGLGTRLLALIEDYARGRGVRELYLLTTTAEAFFAARGFAKCGRGEAPTSIQMTEEYRSLCPASACLMRRLLPATGAHEA